MALQDPDKRVFIQSRKFVDKEIIDKFEGEYDFLSPSFKCDVYLTGDKEPYPSFEHALQASKTDDETKKNAVRLSENIRDAKRVVSKLSATSDWNQNCLNIAEKLLRDKFIRCKDLRKKLMVTEHRTLKYSNNFGDSFWGVNAGDSKVGFNHLGKLLERIRHDIEHGEDQSKWFADNFKMKSADSVRIEIEIVKDGQRLVDSRAIKGKSMVYIGKSEDSDIIQEHPSLSRWHVALVATASGKLLLVDLLSQNGTFIDGEPVKPFVGYPLMPSNVVSFAASKRLYTFKLFTDNDQEDKYALYARMGQVAEDGGDGRDSSNVNELTVFIGNIAFSSTEQDLRTLFSECGTIADLRMPSDRTGENPHKGIAFVRFSEHSGVMRALGMDGDELGGRMLKVKRSDRQAPTRSISVAGNSSARQDRVGRGDSQTTRDSAKRQRDDPHREDRGGKGRDGSQSPTRRAQR